MLAVCVDEAGALGCWWPPLNTWVLSASGASFAKGWTRSSLSSDAILLLGSQSLAGCVLVTGNWVAVFPSVDDRLWRGERWMGQPGGWGSRGGDLSWRLSRPQLSFFPGYQQLILQVLQYQLQFDQSNQIIWELRQYSKRVCVRMCVCVRTVYERRLRWGKEKGHLFMFPRFSPSFSTTSLLLRTSFTIFFHNVSSVISYSRIYSLKVS